MQIQRIQTLYLLAAFICMAVFAFMPMLYIEFPVVDMIDHATLHPYDEWAAIIPVGFSALLLLLDIFLYSDLRLQKRVLKFGILFTVLSAVLTLYMLWVSFAANEPTLSWWTVLMAVAFVFELLAMKGINHDDALLRSADRLR
ncbi:MAG: DUF4293 domain-containing protein [Lachnoclostridium sp.]|nr:DUF4293 domain-containing protein [Lachnoclostridium sp.]